MWGPCQVIGDTWWEHGIGRFRLLRSKFGKRRNCVLCPCRKFPGLLRGRTVCADVKVNSVESQSGGISRRCLLQWQMPRFPLSTAGSLGDGNFPWDMTLGSGCVGVRVWMSFPDSSWVDLHKGDVEAFWGFSEFQLQDLVSEINFDTQARRCWFCLVSLLLCISTGSYILYKIYIKTMLQAGFAGNQDKRFMESPQKESHEANTSPH